MSILKIRILLDHDEQVLRDVEVEHSGTMEDLHETILAAFNISNDQMASFYESDEHWNKGAEIALMDMGTNEEPVQLMSETAMMDKIQDRTRMLYVYDFLNLRIFYLEVIGMGEVNADLEYPQVVMAIGELPKMEDAFDLESLLEGVDPNESRDNVGTADDYLDDEDDAWDEGGGSMENLDDYEGLI